MNITISPRASIGTTSAHFSQQHAGKILGANINAGQPMELRADNKVYPWAGSTSTAAFFGIAPRSGKAGQPITAFGLATHFRASDVALTIGATYYLSDTAGMISDTAGTKDTTGSFFAINAYDLVVTRSFGKVS
ncbi:hypothetical protein [Deinococcus ruber]|uniref:Uncharacterized protein n=1 Tax=Deinococcus ruber TaxID=1848197 RepID=A0A918C1Q7_9DEIO|nr:hypothetical protein [Deinococcus ruber]GGR00252.1 hypothetical protein GCM10008957_11250 [Deinococcus ruber]